RTARAAEPRTEPPPRPKRRVEPAGAKRRRADDRGKCPAILDQGQPSGYPADSGSTGQGIPAVLPAGRSASIPESLAEAPGGCSGPSLARLGIAAAGRRCGQLEGLSTSPGAGPGTRKGPAACRRDRAAFVGSGGGG